MEANRVAEAAEIYRDSGQLDIALVAYKLRAQKSKNLDHMSNIIEFSLAIQTTIEIEPFDRFDRFFRLIKRPDRQFIFPSDFDPFLKELLKYHPGLEFLETAPVSIIMNFHI